VLGALEDVVRQELGNAQKVRISGLVQLTVVVKPAQKVRMGRNPATGEAIKVAAKPASVDVRARPLANDQRTRPGARGWPDSAGTSDQRTRLGVDARAAMGQLSWRVTHGCFRPPGATASSAPNADSAGALVQNPGSTRP
jgi:hypothetical protein